MRAFKLLSLSIIIFLVACQARPTRAVPGNTPIPSTTTADRPTQPEATKRNPSEVEPTSRSTQEPAAQPIDFSIASEKPFADVPLLTYQGAEYPVQMDALPLSLDALGNPGVIEGLTRQQQEFLRQNGFVVIQAGDQQFKYLRKSVSVRNGQPYYLTTDAAYHALHKSFDGLLAALEQEYLRPVLARLLEAQYAKINEYAASAAGHSLETDVQLSQKYLAVAIKLLEPEKMLAPEVETAIAPQIEQIMAYGGRAQSVLIPSFEDDYGAYRPVSHYAGLPELETYFRCMSWLGRVAFKFQDPDVPLLTPSRAPLVMTLALREAQVDGVPAYQIWMDLYRITDFMVGPSDDPGPLELNQLIEQVYGSSLTIADLMDEVKWQQFLVSTNQLPAPQINSTFASFSATQAASRDWRLMGQRFTLDGFIFQSLIFDKVGTVGKPRNLPTGLDIAAAFGSRQALQALETAGETLYANYPEQMQVVQGIVENQPEAQWLNRFYSAWLYAFRPQVAPKDHSFPPYMRTDAWGYKEANSLLGSWAELKHDTVLYAKMPEKKGGGGPPSSGPAPAYVEPNPNVFYRLAYAATTLHQGLSPYLERWDSMNWGEHSNVSDWQAITFFNHYSNLLMLSGRFQTFGDIAAREIHGEMLTQKDFDVIQVCLELKECMDHGLYSGNPPEPDPIPVIAAVSGYEDMVLEAGVGHLNRIYVAVPLEGKLQIAQGGVFSYYEFTQPRTDRLTDQAWMDKLKNDPPSTPAWVNQFVLPDGEAVVPLAFRINDVYMLSNDGINPPLNLRAGPSKADEVLRKLDQNFYLTIIDGPVKNSEGTWWKVELLDWSQEGSPTTGWVMEHQAWYWRATTE